MSPDGPRAPAPSPALAALAQPARGRYEIDGVAPEWVARPESIEQVQEILAVAQADEIPLILWGGGSHQAYGNVPQAAGLALDLGGIAGVADYRPEDLTVSVRAGCTLAELNRVLGERGQMLPVDTAVPERATIGGLVATGLSGPRRFGYGALRDLIIGIATVLPGGRLARGGGMVVKNVTGYDMMRLHYGALGSLGVIVQVNFKVIPSPLAQRTVVASYERLDSAHEAAMLVRLSQLAPTAVVLLNRDAAARAGLEAAPWTLALRGEAPPAAAARQAERFADALAADAARVEIHEEDATGSIWGRISRVLGAEPMSDTLVARLGARPSDLDALIREIDRLLAEAGLGAALTADYGGGLLYLWSDDGDALTRAGGSLWERLQARGGTATHAVLLAAPTDVKREIDVFGPEPEGFAVMRALKERFDPRRILNRGRFVGRL